MKPSLLNAPPGLFSPLYVNSELFESDKAAALYKFSSIFFPHLGPGILNLLLDMEKHCRKIIAAITPEERKKLIRELDGVTVEMNYIIKEHDKEMMKIPIRISPVDVLKSAVLGKAPHRYSERMQKEVSDIIVSLVDKEIQRKMRGMIEGFIKAMMIKPRVPALLKELFKRGLVNSDGHLAEGTTIADLISGRYAKLFKRVVPEELVNEAMLLRKTIKICYDWGERDKDYQALANEALRQKGILEVTLGEIKKKKGKT